ncbi:hypothetical protein [Tunturiibacter lichenicola]|uniref:hypothetical protein n=1 Tax=Tunturiibacter lichenicola TaxID=2051959 RepID=UPI003D9BB41A
MLISTLLLVSSYNLKAQPAAATTPTTNVSTPGQQIATIEGVPTAATAASPLIGIDASGNLDLSAVSKLLAQTVCQLGSSPSCNLDNKSTYVVIHVLVWGDPAPGGDPNTAVQSIKTTNWYVYRNYGTRKWNRWGQGDFSGNNRLYGASKIVLLYLHLNASDFGPHPYSVRYQLTIAKRIPTNLQAVSQLAQLIIPSSKVAAAPTKSNLWGGGVIDVGYKTSDIKVDSFLETPSTTGASTAVSTKLSPTYSLINEPKEYWDVSVAVPVHSVSSLQYTSSNNTVVPTQISKQNVFAALDLYFPPIDLAGSNYSLIPHPIVGVSMASQPLHSILVGGAIGFSFAEVYVANDFVKQQLLNGVTSGGAATPAQLAAASKYSFTSQFTIGINLPIKAAVSALQKATK